VIFIQRAVRRWLKAKRVMQAGKAFVEGVELHRLEDEAEREEEEEKKREAEAREAAADKEAYQK